MAKSSQKRIPWIVHGVPYMRGCKLGTRISPLVELLSSQWMENKLYRQIICQGLGEPLKQVVTRTGERLT